ncbi:MAG: hypothetical protein JWP73_2101 [Phenylobacterium sp.]|nr:hypothetical protein [Phenylobacterium sp.]
MTSRRILTHADAGHVVGDLRRDRRLASWRRLG